MTVSQAPSTGQGASSVPSLDDLLMSAVSHGASDLHIRAGAPPTIRVNGLLTPFELPPLSEAEAEALVLESMPSDRERRLFADEHETDFALVSPRAGRFRVNAYHAKGAAAMVLRHVRTDVPTIESLKLPPVVHELAMKTAGLVLVCGPTGSGKTTTLASMIDAINGERACHILAIEDPIEFMHSDKRASVSQREVHTDTDGFGRALRSAMRQDPDVILIGEIRDLETMRTALQASETGHLVLASLHAKTVVDAVNRVLDIFPAEEQRQARLSLADAIQGIMCQHLVRAADGVGRVMVMEVGVGTQRFRESVADPVKTADLEEIVADGEYYGMKTFEQDAVRLVMAGKISVEEAEKVVPSPADLHVALRRSGYHA